jgi:CO/xanthine dehydrogenase FAD-binding subunit
LLSLAAAEVGAAQIQNRGTIGGNIVNASPAADGLPALYVYGAEVVLASAAGTRVLPVGDFVRGPRRTALEHGEILSEIRVPKLAASGQPLFFFEKVGSRRAQTITKGSVTVHAWLDDGRLVDPRIALGSVGPTIIRAREAERTIEAELTSATIKEAARLVSEAASPIDDIRSTAQYRRELVGGLLLRGLFRNVPGLEVPDLLDGPIA